MIGRFAFSPSLVRLSVHIFEFVEAKLINSSIDHILNFSEIVLLLVARSRPTNLGRIGFKEETIILKQTPILSF